MTDLRLHEENHLGERILRDDGTVEYLKTYRGRVGLENAPEPTVPELLRHPGLEGVRQPQKREQDRALFAFLRLCALAPLR